MSRPCLLSIIIVSYNCKDELAACLDSLRQNPQYDQMEVIVVDNDSHDGTLAALERRYSEVIWIANRENRGFATACNQGLGIARGRYLWLLNPDTLMPAETPAMLISYLEEHPGVGAVGGRLISPDGRFQGPCRRKDPTPIRALQHFFVPQRLQNAQMGYEIRDRRPEENHAVDAVSGACLLFRREVLTTPGYMDESFFFMGEDLDFCKRIREAGFEIHYVGAAPLIHHWGASRVKLPWRVIVERHRAMWRYYEKHVARHEARWMNTLVYTGIVVKFILHMGMNLLPLPRNP